MEQYISKSAVLAEIDRLDALYHTSKSLGGDLFIQGLYCFLDTSEVKDVDLEKEATRFVQTKEFAECEESPVLCLAKHFFELGLKAKQG